jgi:flagellar biosynthesis protein FliQ
MEAQVAVDLCREAALTSLLVGGPLLAVAMLVGLVIGLLQALTQIQDQTVSFVPKLLAMIAILIFCLPWLLQQMVSYSQNVIRDIPQIVAGG